MKVWLEGIGVWGPGISGWADCRARLTGMADGPAECPEPPAAALASQERRRSTASVRLAAEVAAQACTAAGRDPAAYATVSASSAGDLATVHALCATLSTEPQLLSPTRFHNSVHNAPGGYWSIAGNCQQPANALAAGAASFAAGLLEAAVQCAIESRPVMLLAYDLPGPSPLGEASRIGAGLGVALAFSPSPAACAPALQIRYDDNQLAETVLGDPALEALRCTTPAARCLPLLAAVAGEVGGAVTLGMGAGSMTVTISPVR
ncbi:MAG TPA: beta-ketoacyl synthase chain length factor [Gammaproteobacteria bacterium]|nr:beta-ketoacyl synthase chain length factor [Gammaproteobacteria bacterium]